MHKLSREGGTAVDALEQSTAVQALALVLAENLSREDLARASLLLTQLGTTLATIAALQDLESEESE